MANLPSGNSQLSIHLADRALTPILSTSNIPSPNNANSPLQSQAQSQALSSLTTAAISAYDSASRLGLGVPLRIMIEMQTSGPVILHSYLNPSQRPRPQARNSPDNMNVGGIVEQAREDLRPLSGTTNEEGSSTLVNGVPREEATEDAESEETEGSLQLPLMFIASVVAPSAAEAAEARKAAAKLERTGKEIQKEWVREQEESHKVVENGEDG